MTESGNGLAAGAALAALLLLPGAAQAGQVTFYVRGNLTQVEDDPTLAYVDGLQVGERVLVKYTFDTQTPNALAGTFSGSTIGAYEGAVTALSAVAGTSRFDLAPALGITANRINIGNPFITPDTEFIDGYSVTLNRTSGPGPGAPTENFGLSLNGDTSALDSNALTAVPPDASRFSTRRIALSFIQSTGPQTLPRVDGWVASIRSISTVPFDTSAPAVRDAYLGPATDDKLNAALDGLEIALAGLQGAAVDPIASNYTAGFSATCLCGPGGYNAPVTSGFLDVTTDADFGAPGAAVTLDGVTLTTLASFTTAREFIVGTSGANVNTAGSEFQIAGALTANGPLLKTGPGILGLSGGNTWHDNLIIEQGRVRGTTSSLGADIVFPSAFEVATLEFAQDFAGTYANRIIGAGFIEKTGTGVVTLTRDHGFDGTTTVLAGGLALAGPGYISGSHVSVAGGATFDISAADGNRGILSLSGAGAVALGSNALRVDGSAAFIGSISGSGGLSVAEGQSLTLGGANTYTGPTSLRGSVLLTGPGRLSSATIVSMDDDAGFSIAGADGDREIGGLSGAGGVELGANTLTTGGSGVDMTYSGTVSGSGGLTKTGLGLLMLDGTLNYTGTTTIAGGTLIARANLRSDRIVNDATLELFQPGELPLPIDAYSGDISGTGQVRITGSGAVWLRGHNSYGGGTEVLGGTLLGNTDSLQGTIVNQSVLGFYQVTDGTFTGSISGSGSVVQYGPGVLSLGGTNTYTGGTSVVGTVRISGDRNLGDRSALLALEGGTLATGAIDFMIRPLHLGEDGGTIAIDRGGSFTLAGPVSGPGTLRKTGDGSLLLLGSGTYTGGAVVESGLLGGTTQSLVGDIDNRFLLAFLQSPFGPADGTFQGSIHGRGAVAVAGTGTVRFASANSHLGGTFVSGDARLRIATDDALGARGTPLVLSAGTLVLDADIESSRPVLTLPFPEIAGDQTEPEFPDGGTLDTGTYTLRLSGPLEGPGGLRKLGSGAMAIETVARYAGPTLVQAGTLRLMGSLAGDVIVASGARLEGGGSLGGNLTLQPGATLAMTVAADGSAQAPRLAGTTASAAVAGATLDVHAIPGAYRVRTDYTVIEAPGGISGTFADIDTDLAFLTPALEYAADRIVLTLRRNDVDYVQAAVSANQRAVATTLTRLSRDAQGDAIAVLDALNGLDATGAATAFEAISGGSLNNLASVALAGQQAVARAAIGRMNNLDSALPSAAALAAVHEASLAFNEIGRRGDGSALYAAALAASAVDTDPAEHGWWLRGFGSIARFAGSTGTSDVAAQSAGVVGGLDQRLENGAVIGLFAGYDAPEISQDRPSSATSIEAVQIGAYGRTQWHGVQVDAVAGYSAQQYESRRSIALGATTRQALSEFGGHTWNLHLEAGRPLASFPALAPFAAVEWTRQFRESHRESGAGVLDLAVDSTRSDAIRSTIGFDWSSSRATAAGSRVAVDARLGWSHDFAGRPRSTVSLGGDPQAAGILVSGSKAGRDSAVVGVSLGLQRGNGLTVFGAIDAEFGGDRQVASLSGGIRYRW
ncbi:MAG: autotransporter domain-containing protein [Gammaproteobacteria bacterium]